MKRVGLLIIFLIFAILPCNAKSAQDKQVQDNSMPKVFVYHIPEDKENSSEIKTQTFANKVKDEDEDLQVLDKMLKKDFYSFFPFLLKMQIKRYILHYNLHPT